MEIGLIVPSDGLQAAKSQVQMCLPMRHTPHSFIKCACRIRCTPPLNVLDKSGFLCQLMTEAAEECIDPVLSHHCCLG